MTKKIIRRRGARVWVSALIMCVLWMGAGTPRSWAEDAPATAEEKPAADAAAPEAAEEKPAADAGEAEKPEAKAPQTPRLKGSFSTQLDGVSADGASDLDLEQTLSFDVRPGNSDRLRLRGLLWMQEDLDGDESEYSSLRSINDSYDSDVRARLLSLYAEAKDIWGKSVLRVGRQQILDGVAYNRIDGIYFNRQQDSWEWYAFAGARASVYEDTHEDLAMGAGVTFRPGISTRAGFDIFYGEDRQKEWVPFFKPAWQAIHLYDMRRETNQIENTMLSFNLSQDLWQNATAYGRVTWVDGHGEELLLDLTGIADCWGLSYELRYRRQLDSIGERVNDLTGFYSLLGTYERYDDYLLVLTKELCKKASLSLEAEIHESAKDSWRTRNRDYQRLALVGRVQDLLPTLDTEVSLERWHVQDGEGTWAVTGELTKNWKTVRLSLGADYERYEDRVAVYNSVPDTLALFGALLNPTALGTGLRTPWGGLWSIETHENVHSFYSKLRWAVCKDQEFTASVRYEQDESPESPYWRLRAGYMVRF